MQAPRPDKAELLNKWNAEQQLARRGSGGGGEPTIAARASESPAAGPVAAAALCDPYTFLGAVAYTYYPDRQEEEEPCANICIDDLLAKIKATPSWSAQARIHRFYPEGLG